MNLIDIRAQIEEELSWRQNEIRFFRNQLANIALDVDKMRYRKALVVMLYSHYEGFCKTTFLIYINCINQELIMRSQANDYINTVSLANIFKAYGNTDKKCKIFKNALPDDEKLHLFSRQVDFVNMLDGLWKEKVLIPEEIIDTESNLKPIVMRKLLFRLGFAHNCFEKYEGGISFLLDKRNNIAHGVEKDGLTELEYNDVEKATFEVMEELMKLLLCALETKTYLKSG